MSYKTYRKKSNKRRDELRVEFEKDTGLDLREREKQRILNHLNNLDFGSNRDSEYEKTMEQLTEMGVPFAPDGTPMGSGWDDLSN